MFNWLLCLSQIKWMCLFYDDGTAAPLPTDLPLWDLPAYLPCSTPAICQWLFQNECLKCEMFHWWFSPCAWLRLLCFCSAWCTFVLVALLSLAVEPRLLICQVGMSQSSVGKHQQWTHKMRWLAWPLHLIATVGGKTNKRSFYKFFRCFVAVQVF